MAAKDFYLYFSGTQGGYPDKESDRRNGGVRKDVGDMDEFKGITQRDGFELERWVWTGSIYSDRGVLDARDRLLAEGRGESPRYVPGVSRLIIYGYSAGGKNALELCREFDKNNANPAKPFDVTVDLLATVDAAAWDDSDTIPRDLGKCVKRNVNYYQRDNKRSGSRGNVNTGNRATQKLDEQFERSEDHGKMNDAVRPMIKKAIQETLDAAIQDQVPLVGQWDWVIGSFKGLLEFTANGDVSWQHADPEQLKKDPKKRPGTWWSEGAEYKWSHKLANPADRREFVVRRPLGKTTRGNTLPAGSGFFDMTKR
jgi:hypothetical protein